MNSDYLPKDTFLEILDLTENSKETIKNVEYLNGTVFENFVESNQVFIDQNKAYSFFSPVKWGVETYVFINISFSIFYYAACVISFDSKLNYPSLDLKAKNQLDKYFPELSHLSFRIIPVRIKGIHGITLVDFQTSSCFIAKKGTQEYSDFFSFKIQKYIKNH
jgi:hypothetical protein